MKTLYLYVFFFVVLTLSYSFDARAVDATFDNLTTGNFVITGTRSSLAPPPVEIEHTSTGQSFFVRSLNSNDGLNNGGIGFGTDSNLYPLWVFDTARSETLSLRAEGVGIGSYYANFPLHVYADGSPFLEARAVIQNALPSTADREMLTLINNGGVQINVENTDSGTTWVLQSTADDVFDIGLEGDSSGLVFVRGEFAVLSDKNAKENLKTTNGTEILRRVQKLPLYTFQFKNSQNGAHHLGPMAQDFSRLFNLGNSPKSISPMDGLGVALASIQGLNTKLEERDNELRSLRSQLEVLAKVVADLKSTVEE